MRTRKNGCGLAVLTAAAFGLLSNLQAQTISAWKSAVNGNWSSASAWSAGVPNANMAHLTNYLASYAVTYNSVNPAFKDLRIENTGAQKTDLLISAPLVSNGGAALRFRRGSRVTVNPGGVWRFDGAVNTVTDNGESMLSIADGGELNVAGGTVAFTNLPNASGKGNFLNVGYQSAGTLNVTDGTLSYYETYPRAVTNDNRGLRVGWGNNGDGTLNISGGNVLLGKNMAYTDQTLMSVGYGNGPGTGTRGKVVVSGGTLQFTNSLSWSLLLIGRNGGHGTLVVTNTGYVRLNYATGGRVQIGVAPTAYGLLRMDGGYLWANDGITVGYSLNYKNNSTTGAVEVTAGNANAGSGFVAGYSESNAGDQNTAAYGTGVGTVTIGGGRLSEDYWGTFIGRARRGGEGIGSMTITNGLFDIVSSSDPEAPGGAAGNGAYSGLAIGCINFNETNPYTRARGTLTVAGSGIITNAGVFLVGINGGTGTVVQTGGKIVHAPSGGVADRKMTVIGYNFGASAAVGGGYGSYEMSGGIFSTSNRVFVGGVPTGVQSYARPNSTGLLKVNGGSFTVTNNTLMVGGNGAGTLVIGAGGICYAKDIVLTNNTQATLRFELGSTGLGTLQASGNLAAYTGAKVEVDTMAYQGTANRIKLLDCATRTGIFSPANITVIGPGQVLQSLDEDIYLQVGDIWDGGGADSNVNTANNWAMNTVPPLDGSQRATFGTGGSTATVNTSASFLGLTFNRDSDFMLANGAGTLTLGAGGIAARVPTATSRTYALAESLTLGASQTWGITNNGAGVTTLAVSGVIGGASGSGLTQSGNGILALSGVNTYAGVTTVKTNSILRVSHANALGTTVGNTVIENGGKLEVSGGITLSEPISLTGQGPNSGCAFSSSGNNTLNGLVTIGTGARINGGGTLTFAGGITSVSSPFTILNTAGGTIQVLNAPISIGSGSLWSDQGGTLVLGVAGNTWGNTVLSTVAVRTDAANVFPAATEVSLSNAAQLDLNGYNQTFNRLKSTGGGTVVTSGPPATLTLNQTANTTFDGRLRGAIMLVKGGTASLTLSNANDNAGGMIVSNGTLKLITGSCIADSSRVEISNVGKMEINAGLTETVQKLYFGGTQQHSGTWGATGSGATYIDNTRFAGAGKLNVLLGIAPSITTQPASATVNVGQTATFSVTAGGSTPFTYQWRVNGVNIAGATGASYTTPATVAGDSGKLFSVVVANSAGSVTSANATLTVRIPPTITTQPANASVNLGQTATFSVTAGGTAPLSYQWRMNGVNIAGATSSSYITPATVASDNGKLFSVVVANSAGSVTSVNAALTVIFGTLWDAGAGATTSINAPANWNPDVAPPFDGTQRVTFGTGGSTATVNTSASFLGLTFNRAADFALADGAGTLTLGSGGIAAKVPTATSRTYTITESLTLSASQTWSVTNNGAGVATLSVSGSITGPTGAGFTKSGNGPLVLSGPNTYAGVTTVKTGGCVRVTHASALGTTAGNTVVENGGWLEVSGNITVAEPIQLNGDAASYYAGALRSTGGANIWSGAITQGSATRIGVSGGSSLEITGGFTGTQGLAFQHGGTLKFSGQPIAMGSSAIYAHGGGVWILNAAGNSWGTIDLANGTLRTDLPNAMPAMSTLQLSPNAMFDLNGNSQTLGQFKNASATIGSRLVTSAAPATLTINQSATTYYDGRLTGALGLVKGGTGTLTLSNALNTLSGNVTVSGGTLTVAPCTRLGNSTNIAVNGGTLVLQSSSATTNTASLRVASGGAKVNVAGGVIATVGRLYLNGVQQASGTWGASGSGAQHTNNTYFAGSGWLQVSAPFIQESFDYAVGGLDGTQSNGVGFAASNWGTSGATIVPGLLYRNLMGLSGNAMQSSNYGAQRRDTAVTFGGSTFYMSMLINPNNIETARFGFELMNGSNGGPLFGRVGGGWGMFAGVNGSMGISNLDGSYKTWVGVSNKADNVAHLIVVKVDYPANAIKLFVDPILTGAEPLPSATLTTGGKWTVNLNSQTWNAIRLFHENANQSVDELRIGASWADVAPTKTMGAYVQEGFDYLVGVLDGTQAGGIGFTTNHWGTSGAAIADGLSYSSLNCAGGGALRSTSWGSQPRNTVANFGGGTFYMGMLINSASIETSRFGFELLAGGGGHLFGRVSGGWGMFAGVNGLMGVSNTVGNYQTWTGVAAAADNASHLIVAKIDYEANAIKLFVDPVLTSSEPAPSATLTTGGNWTVNLNTQLWNGVRLFHENAGQTADELRIGRTWASVVPVRSGAEITEFFIAPSGNGVNPGTQAAPFGTLEQARDALRLLRVDNELPLGGLTVWLLGGNYARTNTFELTAADSGSASRPISYRAYPGETVRIHGAQQLQPAWFTTVQSSSPVWPRIDTAARGNVMQIHLPTYGITDYGTLRQRGMGSSSTIGALELFFDGAPQQLARWPDVGQTSGTEATNGWAYTDTPLSTTNFTYIGTRPSRWILAEDLWIHGFLGNHWADYHLRPFAVNTTAHTVTFTNAPNYGIADNMPYYAENLLEEITRPGEWYVNRASGILYFWPPAAPAGHEIQVSMMETNLVRLSGVQHVIWRDITFEAVRGDLLAISGCGNVRVLDCLLRNSGNYAAKITGGTRNGLSGCEVKDTGDGGISMTGGARNTLTGAGNYVRNCTIHAFGRFDWMNTQAVKFEGVGQIVEHNLIYDSPHTAIGFAGANYCSVAYNEVRDVCKWSSDAGAIYTGRDLGAHGSIIGYNFVHHVVGQFGAGVGLGTQGIYLDDCIAGIEVFGNICYKVSGMGIQHGSGRDDVMRNNVIVKCGEVLYADTRGLTWGGGGATWSNTWANLQAMPYRGTIWSNAFPQLYAMPTNWVAVTNSAWLAPRNSVFSRNLGYANTSWVRDAAAIAYYAEFTNNLQNSDPLFVNEALTNMTLSAGSPAFTIPGFVDIPFSRIGPEKAALRELAAWDFPTATDRIGFSSELLAVPSMLSVNGMTAIAAPGHPTWSVDVPFTDITGTNQALAVAAGDYFEVTLTPLLQGQFSLAALSFAHRRNTGGGSATLFVRSSADNYSSTLGSVVANGPNIWNETTFSLSGVAALQNRTTSVTIRLYAYKPANDPGTQRLAIDNLSVRGTTLPMLPPQSLRFRLPTTGTILTLR